MNIKKTKVNNKKMKLQKITYYTVKGYKFEFA